MRLLGKEGRSIDRLGGRAPSNLSLFPSTTQFFPPSLLFNGHLIESGLLNKVLYTNKPPNHLPAHLSALDEVYPHLRNVQWEEVDRGGGWHLPHMAPANSETQGHRSEP